MENEKLKMENEITEVEKMYENAGVKKQIPKICSSNELYCKECEAHIEDAIPYCKNAEYPPFTAEKQLSLIKWLSRRYIEISNYDAENGRMYNIKPTVGDFATSFNYDFSECIAGLINNLWHDLTESEQEQIRSILNG